MEANQLLGVGAVPCCTPKTWPSEDLNMSLVLSKERWCWVVIGEGYPFIFSEIYWKLIQRYDIHIGFHAWLNSTGQILICDSSVLGNEESIDPRLVRHNAAEGKLSSRPTTTTIIGPKAVMGWFLTCRDTCWKDFIPQLHDRWCSWCSWRVWIWDTWDTW